MAKSFDGTLSMSTRSAEKSDTFSTRIVIFESRGRSTAMTVGVFQLHPTTSPQSAATTDLLDHIRNDVIPPVEESTGAQNVYTGQRVSLDFKDADIVNVLRLLSEIGGENVVITDDVRGRITLRLVDVPWDQAFNIVLATNGLGPSVRCDP